MHLFIISHVKCHLVEMLFYHVILSYNLLQQVPLHLCALALPKSIYTILYSYCMVSLQTLVTFA